MSSMMTITLKFLDDLSSHDKKLPPIAEVFDMQLDLTVVLGGLFFR